MRIGLVGAGAMGSALGAGWLASGHEVVTSGEGRSVRTRALVADAGITTVDSLDDVLRSDLVVSVLPPGAAVQAAHDIAAAAGRSGRTPPVADLNAISPPTVAEVADVLGRAGLTLIDGSISGPPPRPDRQPRVYLSGPDTAAFTDTSHPWLDVVVLDGPVGTASALKMCTASVYKGTSALIMQAMRAAERFGVLDAFLADTARVWPDAVPHWPADVALAATKSARYVAEMREIAATQQRAGLPRQLFEAMADVYAEASRTPLGHRAPESVDTNTSPTAVLDGLRPEPTRAVLFDFSGTLFHIEPAQQAVLAALGADEVHRTDELARAGALNGSNSAAELPGDLERLWDERDLSPDAHRAAYTGVSRLAGLDAAQADALYARGVDPQAWLPYPDTAETLHRLRRAGVPVAIVSNIGWDPRPVLHRYGVAEDVDVLVLSDERGVQKPDPAIFTLALDELGVPAERCVFIGDTATTDGACTQVGIRFVQVGSDEREREPDTLLRAAGLVR